MEQCTHLFCLDSHGYLVRLLLTLVFCFIFFKIMMRFFLFLNFFYLLAYANTFAQRDLPFNVGENGLAAGGYDVLSYYVGKPVEGKRGHAVFHDGVLYYFSSAENEVLFVASPEKYIPRYGGWCAYAMGKSGEKVGVNPESYKILDGRLYLFYNRYGVNTLKKWNEDEAFLRLQAGENWRVLVQGNGK